jgi:uncharacterized RDD family membrane protein YckC
MRVQPESDEESERRRRARIAHVAAAARAQADAAARAREVVRAPKAPRWSEAERDGTYAGLVTRAIAYSLDIALINFVSLAVGIAVGLAASLVPDLPDTAVAVGVAIGGVAYLLWFVAYFVTFWSTTGQTPGSRLMRIRVIDADGDAHVKPRRAIVRFVGLVLATIPLFAGFIIMLWDDRRRCLQDRMAGTTVIHAPPQTRIVRRAIPREE